MSRGWTTVRDNGSQVTITVMGVSMARKGILRATQVTITVIG